MQENQHPNDTDEHIVALIQQGQSDLFAEVLKRYEAKILRYGRKFMRDQKDVEDVTQEVFIKAYRNIQGFDASRRFSPWLYRIAHNECVNFLRKRKIESIPLFELDVLFPHVAHEQQKRELSAQEAKDIMEHSLDKLDIKYREPLVLYYIEGFDYKEIADILQIPVATVGVRLSRAKKMLRDHVEGM